MRENFPTRAVVFDMDGVLTDSEPLINAAAVAMFKEKGLGVQPDDFVPFIGTGEDRYIGGVAEKYNFALEISSAKHRTYEIYLELVAQRLHAFPGAVDLVTACRKAGLKVAVASSADVVKIHANLNKIGLPPESWDAIVSAEDVENKKPAPDIFLAAARKLGVPPDQCVVIEDAVNGVQAAKAAGARCVAVAQTFPVEKLQAADVVKGKISDLTVSDLLSPTGEAGVPSAPPTLCEESAMDPSATASAETRRPWGFWATMGLSAVIFVAFVSIQAAVLVVAVALNHALDLKLSFKNIESNGLLLAVATCAAAPIEIGLCWLFAWLRRGLPVSEYLGIRRVTRRQVFRWCTILFVFVLVSDAITAGLGRPVVPEFMVSAYRTAGFAPMLYLALLVAAPMSEEILFRGFMFEGLRQSPLGGWGAIALTSLLWALIHLQYDLFGIGTIFVAGLMLGYARWKTNSVCTPILMHALMNLIATIQVMSYVHFTDQG